MQTRPARAAPPPVSVTGEDRPRLIPPPVVIEAERRSEPVVVGLVGVAIFVLLGIMWRGGWLLLLDWSPGPGGAGAAALTLPSGPVMVGLHWGLHSIDPHLAGWAAVAGAVALSYFGGVRLARCWRDRAGHPMSWLAAGVAGVVAATNPFVVARVYTGQIGVLWGSALLWFYVAALATAMEDGERDELRDLRRPVVAGMWLALAAACSLHLLVIGLLPLMVCSLLKRRSLGVAGVLRRSAVVFGVAGVVTAIWLVPSYAAQSARLSPPGGEAAAALFVDHGPILTLWWRAAGGAGFWRPLPAGLTWPFGVMVGCGWIGLVAAWRFGRGRSRDLRRLLVGSALSALPLAYLGRGWLLPYWGWMVRHLPPAGLLREPGKALVLVVMAPAAGAGAAVQAVRAQLNRRTPALASALTAAMLVLAGAASLLAWASVAGAVRPSRYPEDWEDARAAVAADTCAVVVLGDGAYTWTGFTGARVVAHPATGFFGERAVVSTDAGVPGVATARPSAPSQRWLSSVEAATRRGHGDRDLIPEAAAAAGIGWLFLDRPVDRAELAATLTSAGFAPAHLGDAGGLWRVPGGCGGGS